MHMIGSLLFSPSSRTQEASVLSGSMSSSRSRSKSRLRCVLSRMPKSGFCAFITSSALPSATMTNAFGRMVGSSANCLKNPLISVVDASS